jgi:hypothetical protein
MHKIALQNDKKEGETSMGSLENSGADIDPLFSSFAEVLHDMYDEPGEFGQHMTNAMHAIAGQRIDDSAGYITHREKGVLNPFEVISTPSSEDKDVMHFTPQNYLQAHEYFRTRGGLQLAARGLLEHCNDLYEETKKAVAPALGALGLSPYILAPGSAVDQNVHLMRLLHYPPRSLDELLSCPEDARAKLHFDRSKLTAAVWESAPGLMGIPANNAYGQKNLLVDELESMAAQAVINPIDHHSGQVKLFAGAAYNRMPEDLQIVSGKIQPLLHGVLNGQPDENRYAVVVFMNEHLGISSTSTIAGGGVPTKAETDYDELYKTVLHRQMRMGGLVDVE